jgi:hypothetical protein
MAAAVGRQGALIGPAHKDTGISSTSQRDSAMKSAATAKQRTPYGRGRGDGYWQK